MGRGNCNLLSTSGVLALAGVFLASLAPLAQAQAPDTTAAPKAPGRPRPVASTPT